MKEVGGMGIGRVQVEVQLLLALLACWVGTLLLECFGEVARI